MSGSTYTYNVGALAGGAGGSVNFGVTVDDPATSFTITNTVSIADDDANGVDATPANNIATDVDIISVPPVLDAIGNKNVDELTTLIFTATATDGNAPPQTLTFSLDAGAPSGASIGSSSGVFNWTPTEAQGPGTYTVTVRVTDNGSPALDDFETFNITVNEVNGAPTLGAIGDKTVDELTTLTFTATVTDGDLPANIQTFSLDAGAPNGASIGSSNGVFNWTPTEAEGPGVYTVTVRVTDSGSPTLNDFETFAITVNETNTAPVLGAIGNKIVDELATLVFTATVTDVDEPVQTLTFSLDAGAPSGASIGSSSGVFTWTPNENQGPGVYTATVRVTDNGSPAQNDFEAVVITVNEANQAPVADDDTFQVEVDSVDNPLDVLTGDTDADLPAQTLTIVAVGSTSNGGTVFNNGSTLSYTPTASFQGTETFTYTMSDGNGGTDTGLVTVDVSSIRYIYLPLVAKNYANGPDLVVQSLTSNGNNVQVVIANQGTVSVSSPAEEFWVDVYINPTTPPTAVNQVWRTVGTQGLVWGVTASAFPLCPSQTLTLTVGDAYYFASDSVVSFPLPNGTPLYAQVDSYNPSTSYGVVRENHELMGLAYNNITSGAVVTGPSAADMPLPPTVFVQREPDVNLPKRPQ